MKKLAQWVLMVVLGTLAVFALFGATLTECLIYTLLGVVLFCLRNELDPGLGVRCIWAYLGVAWLISAWEQAPVYWVACGALVPSSVLAACLAWFAAARHPVTNQSQTRSLALSAMLVGLGLASALLLTQSALVMIGTSSVAQVPPYETASKVLASSALVVAIAMVPAGPWWMPRLVGAWSLCLAFGAMLTVMPGLNQLYRIHTLLKSDTVPRVVPQTKYPNFPAWHPALESFANTGRARLFLRQDDLSAAITHWRQAQPLWWQQPVPFDSKYQQLLAQGDQLPRLDNSPYVKLAFDPPRQRVLAATASGMLLEIGEQLRPVNLKVEGETRLVDCEVADDGTVYVLWASGLITWHDSRSFQLVGQDQGFVPGNTELLLVLGAVDLVLVPRASADEQQLYFALGPYGGCYTNGEVSSLALTSALHRLLHYDARGQERDHWRGIARQLLIAPDRQTLFLGTLYGQVFPIELTTEDDGTLTININQRSTLARLSLTPPDESPAFALDYQQPWAGYALWNNGTIHPLGIDPTDGLRAPGVERLPFPKGFITPRLRTGEQAIDFVWLARSNQPEQFFFLTNLGRVYTNVGQAFDLLLCQGERDR